MAKNLSFQQDYVTAYEKSKDKRINTGIINLAEMNFNIKQSLRKDKFDKEKKAENYGKKIDDCFSYMLTTFFKIDEVSPIYKGFQNLFAEAYLDDEVDYRERTKAKLNRIYGFVNDLGEQDLSGTALLSLIRRELTDGRVDEPINDTKFDAMFAQILFRSETMQLLTGEQRMSEAPHFLEQIATMESYLFSKRFFYDDYRKSVTGLANYLLARAGMPEIYINPSELKECYRYAQSGDKEELVVFYKEKICDSVKDLMIAPMKEINKKAFDDNATGGIHRDFTPSSLELRLN